MDGAMGTAIHQHDLPIDEFGGPAFENCNEVLNPRRPDIILDIHSSYLEAGSDIIETNSFNGTPADMGEFGLKERTQEINRKAAALARQAAEKYSTPAVVGTARRRSDGSYTGVPVRAERSDRSSGSVAAAI